MQTSVWTIFSMKRELAMFSRPLSTPKHGAAPSHLVASIGMAAMLACLLLAAGGLGVAEAGPFRRMAGPAMAHHGHPVGRGARRYATAKNDGGSHHGRQSDDRPDRQHGNVGSPGDDRPSPPGTRRPLPPPGGEGPKSHPIHMVCIAGRV